MKYPRLSRKDSLACKLTESQIALIMLLYEDGVSQRSLARMFLVNRCTIVYWVNDDFREKHKAKKRAKIKSNDPTRETCKLHKRRRRLDPLFREWCRQVTAKYYDRKRWFL